MPTLTVAASRVQLQRARRSPLSARPADEYHAADGGRRLRGLRHLAPPRRRCLDGGLPPHQHVPALHFVCLLQREPLQQRPAARGPALPHQRRHVRARKQPQPRPRPQSTPHSVGLESSISPHSGLELRGCLELIGIFCTRRRRWGCRTRWPCRGCGRTSRSEGGTLRKRRGSWASRDSNERHNASPINCLAP